MIQSGSFVQAYPNSAHPLAVPTLRYVPKSKLPNKAACDMLLEGLSLAPFIFLVFCLLHEIRQAIPDPAAFIPACTPISSEFIASASLSICGLLAAFSTWLILRQVKPSSEVPPIFIYFGIVAWNASFIFLSTSAVSAIQKLLAA